MGPNYYGYDIINITYISNFFVGECFLPVNTSNLELIRRDSIDSDNTTSSLNIVLRCRDGVDDWMAVCSSNGTWIPDLDEIECHNIIPVTLTAVTPSEILTAKKS